MQSVLRDPEFVKANKRGGGGGGGGFGRCVGWRPRWGGGCTCLEDKDNYCRVGSVMRLLESETDL